MEVWDGGSDYESFMGRWSRLVADEFVKGLAAPEQLQWLDVGCGTGALLGAVIGWTNPSRAAGVDPSPEFAEAARGSLGGDADIQVATGELLPFDTDTFDRVVSGLALNFMPDPLATVLEWKRVTRPGGSIHVYVWDYADGMGFLRHFWNVVSVVHPEASHLDEGARFPICEPSRLSELFGQAGLSAVEGGHIDVATRFEDFDDFWAPFLRGQGPAPTYVGNLSENQREQLQQTLRARLSRSTTGSIDLGARAWTITGVV